MIAIAPRLTEAEIITSFRVRTAQSLAACDPRLAGDQFMLRAMVLVVAEVRMPDAVTPIFVEWPDASLGSVFLAGDQLQRDRSLVAAYNAARHTLEQLALASLANASAALH